MVLVVLVIVIALLGLAVWAIRRRGSDELHSVAGYQHRLERLEEARRRQTGSVRVVGGTGHRPGGGMQPGQGDEGRREISSSLSPRRVFEETERRSPPPLRRSLPPPRRRRDRSIALMSHRPRRLAAPIAVAAAVIVLVTVLAVLGANSRKNPHSNTATTTASSAPHQSHTATKHSNAPTRTVPSTFSPSSSSGNQVSYTLPFSSYTIVFTATNGDCYVQLTEANGNVPLAQVLTSGTRQQLTVSGISKVVLGAPTYVTVQIDRTPVTFPTPLAAPLDITFSGSTPTTSSSTTSTT